MTGARRGIVAAIVSALVATGLTGQQAPVAPQAPLQITLQEAVRRALEVQPAMGQARGEQRNARAHRRSAPGAFPPTAATRAPAARRNTSSIRSLRTDTP